MTKTIDLSLFDNVSANTHTIDQVTRKIFLNERKQLVLEGNNYIYFNLPGEFPIGTKITATVTLKTSASIDGTRISFDSYPKSDYANNKILELSLPAAGKMFKKYTLTHVVRPGRQYVRLVIGNWNTYKGEVTIRSVKMTYSTPGPENLDIREKLIYSNTINKSNVTVPGSFMINSPGTVTTTDDGFLISTEQGGGAYLNINFTNTTNFEQLVCKINGRLKTGTAVCVADYPSGLGIFKHTILNNKDTHWFKFPRVDGSLPTKIVIGGTSNVIGSFELRSVDLFGVEEPISFCSGSAGAGIIKKDNAGNWILPSGHTNSLIKAITPNELSLTIDFKTPNLYVPNTHPITQVQIDSYGDQDLKYDVHSKFSRYNQVTLTLIDKKTGVRISPASVTGELFITLASFF